MKFSRITNRISTPLLTFGMVTVRSLVGPVYCSFEIGCTTFAITQLKNQSLMYAFTAIGKRLIACTFPRSTFMRNSLI